MKNGIGPQSLGAPGTSPNSKPCGTPLDFNDTLRQKAEAGELNRGFTKAIKENDPALNSGSPLPFQDDITKIQEAAGVLEAHNIGGGGGEVQGAAAAAQESAAAQIGQAKSSIFSGSLFGRMGKIGRDKIRTISAMGARMGRR